MASLTSRGRTLLSAGATAVGGGLLLGQTTLTAVGVLLATLPLLALLAVTRSRSLTVERSVSPRRVPAGQPARIDLRLDGGASSGHVRVEDRVPWALGVRPRVVVPGGRRAWSAPVDYTVRADLRGRYPLGPLVVQALDPFGLASRTETVAVTGELVVTPRVVPLPATGRAGAWTGAGDNRPRAFAAGSAEDVTVRDYRPGDPLRRVHWRSSARTGELMVRREEQPWQSRATLLIDNRVSAHRGQGVGSSLECAVSLAASVTAHLASRGFVVRLVTADGPLVGDAWHDRAAPTDADRLLEELALLEPVRRTTLATDWLSATSRHGMVVAVLGEIADDEATLRRVLHHADPAWALVLDVARWGGGTGGDQPALPLQSSGWRAVTVSPDTPFAAAWSQLGSGR